MKRRINGQGTLLKLDNGKMRLKVQHGYLSGGAPRMLTVTGTSETDCRRKMEARIKEVSGQKVNKEEYRKLTLVALCTNHLKQHLGESDRLKPKAADRRESTIRNQIQRYPIGMLQAATVTPQDVNEHIEKLIKEQKLSVSSIEKTFNVINSAYKWAISKGFTTYNPCESIKDSLINRFKNLKKRNSVDGVVHVLGDDEIAAFEKMVEQLATEDENRYLFGKSALILLETGMRVGELCALRWRDLVETKEGTSINISKTRFVSKNRKDGENGYSPDENCVKNSQFRAILLTEKAKTLFEYIRTHSPKTAPDDYIILNTRNNPTNPSNYGDRLKGLFEKAGFSEEISGAHLFRRTCATRMYNNGCKIQDIAGYLGDLPETISKHYISVTKRTVSDDKVVYVVPVPTPAPQKG